MGVIWGIFSQLRGGLGRGDVTSFIAFVLVMVKEPALSRKSPHLPLCQGGQGGISGYPFADSERQPPSCPLI